MSALSLSMLSWYSGLLQALLGLVVACLAVALIWWTRTYAEITERIMEVTQNQAAVLKELWDYTREPKIVLRVPPWREPLTLEIANVGEPTLVLHSVVLKVPVSTHSMSTITLNTSPPVVLAKNAFHEISLDAALRQFIKTRNIPAETFQSLVEVMVVCKSWDKQVAVSMWILAQMRRGEICPSQGPVNLSAGRDLAEFQLYEQRIADQAKMPVPLPLSPGIH